MVWALIALLTVLWFIGLAFDIAGAFANKGESMSLPGLLWLVIVVWWCCG